MKIYLDFDGTVVEHKYPNIGKYNDGAFEVVKKLIGAGHEIRINTYRANILKDRLFEALEYCEKVFEVNPIRYETSKRNPLPWDFQLFEQFGEIYIDDCGVGHPLKNGMIDWAVVNLEFESNGIY